MSKEKQKREEILEEIENLFKESFQSFVDARLLVDRASSCLKQARRLMSTKQAYDAILNSEDGNDFFVSDNLLAEIEAGTRLWRNYMLETERQQIPKETRNKIFDFYIKDYH